jgi:hypothetical protein
MIIFLALFGFSFWWFLNYSSLLEYPRKWILEKPTLGGSKWPNWIRPFMDFISELYSCPYCVTFHIVWIYYLKNGHGFIHSIACGFVAAILAYFFHLIEKLLVKRACS